MAGPGLVVPGRKHQNRATNGIPFLALSLFQCPRKRLHATTCVGFLTQEAASRYLPGMDRARGQKTPHRGVWAAASRGVRHVGT